jgi:hypothetical protein
MTRASVIVSVWLLLTGNIGDLVRAEGDGSSPLRLLLFYAAITALMVLGLWVQFNGDDDDASETSGRPPRRGGFHYD